MNAPKTINQKNAEAGGDITGGNKTVTTVIHNHAPSNSVVERLLQKLNLEMESNAHVRDTIETLSRYYEKRSHDGVDGLEAKLAAADRADETLLALEKKEMFSKALERWSLYSSAQEIFVHLLAKAEHEFSLNVFPQIGDLKQHEINQLVTDKIVNPIVDECGASVFQMNHGTAMGMLYWLAEQCFVRWHK